jgi:hypothetical protein
MGKRGELIPTLGAGRGEWRMLRFTTCGYLVTARRNSVRAGGSQGLSNCPAPNFLPILFMTVPPRWGSKGNAVRARRTPNTAAAPATVGGESSVKRPLGSRVPGRRRKVVTREPGDLPSAVVMRERCRSGCNWRWANQSSSSGWAGHQVRGDVPQGVLPEVSRCFPMRLLPGAAAAASLSLSCRSHFMPFRPPLPRSRRA